MKSLLMAVTALVAISGVAKADDPLKGLPAPIAKIHQALIDSGVCQADTPESGQTVVLAKGTTLLLVPCLYGAYQGSMRGYITQDENQIITQIATLDFDQNSKSVVGTVELMEASYNAKTHVMTTFDKARGIGDCGTSSKTIISVDKDQDVIVKTVEVRNKSTCDVKYNQWPLAFKQK